MLESWKEPRWAIDHRGMSGVMGSVAFWLGLVFVVVGIIAEAKNTALGLEPMSWFLLAIAAFVLGLAYSLWCLIGLYFHVRETKSKKE